MKGKCDWEGCKEKARYKIQELNIELCEKHYMQETEPNIALAKSENNDVKLTRVEASIVTALKRNGIVMSASKLQNTVSALNEGVFDKALENLVTKGIVAIK
jgi:hypothetical protein